MVKPNNELQFALSDLYPNWGGIDTSQLAVPESDDLEALNENGKVAEESKTTASNKNIIIAIIVFIALTIFFGGK